MEGGTETQRQECSAASASVYRVLKVALHPEVGGTVGGVTARPEALDLRRLEATGLGAAEAVDNSRTVQQQRQQKP